MNPPVPPIRHGRSYRSQRRIADRWKHLANKRMAEKLTSHEALSVLDEGAVDDLGQDGVIHYKLRRFVDERDYCDPEREFWIWSIGRRIATGEIIASTTGEFYLNKEYRMFILAMSTGWEWTCRWCGWRNRGTDSSHFCEKCGAHR